MKKIFKYFGLFLSVALVTACFPEENEDLTEVGLSVKTIFPTKVVAGMEMTVNGSGFTELTEVVFPSDISVTIFKVVTDNMIRVTAPKGMAEEGGKIIVKTATDQAESRTAITVGKTVISGYSKQDGEDISGGEQLTIYGTDLEFISSVDIQFVVDNETQHVVIKDSDFYRKGTSNVMITLPKKMSEDKVVISGKVKTLDGREFDLPTLNYEPASDGGHWETVKTVIWENEDPEGNGVISWSGKYRFGLEGNDGNNECIATFDADTWNKIKTEKFYMMYVPADPTSYQIRVTTGWWSVQWLGADNDIAPWNMADRIIDNEDGSFYIEVEFGADPIVDALDEQHLLFTGNGYTPMALYFSEDVWVEGEGHLEIVKTSLWKNEDPEGNGVISWSGKYRFGLEGNDGNNECIATFDADTWNKIKTEKFYMMYVPADPTSYQIRVTTGWWSVQWLGADNDIAPWNMADRIIDNGDGTFYIEVEFGEDPILDVLDEQHLLFTGNGYTPMELYFQEEVWVGGGGAPKEVDIWVNDDPEGNGVISWSGKYRFGLEGNDGNNECITTFDADTWNKIKTGTFYMSYVPADPTSYQIRVTTGWWSVQWQGADNDIAPWNLADMIIDDGDGSFHIEINFGEDPIVGSLDEQHLLFTGNGYTPMKLYFLE